MTSGSTDLGSVDSDRHCVLGDPRTLQLSELLCMAAAAAAYVPRLAFHGALAPALSWDASLDKDPLVSFDPGDDFLSFIMKVPGLGITQVTTGAGPATSYTIQFSNLEGILTPAFHCAEAAALDECIILGFTGLVHLSHLIDAIIEEGDLDTSSSPDNVPELFKQIEAASNKARADERTWRVASMTELVEPATGAMSVQKCLTHSIRRRHIMDAGDNCRLEALVLRTFSPRFLHASRTAEFANALIMPEATRSLIEAEARALNNASAQKLALKKSCVEFVVRAIGKRWRMIEFPAEFMSLPIGQEDSLEFWETLCAFSFGSESQRKMAFSTLHLSVLESYTHLSTMLTDNCHRQPSERLEFYYLAVEMYMPGQNPLSLSTMESLDSLVALLELKRLSEGKANSLVPDNIKFHKDDMDRLHSAMKQDAKGAETVSGSLANKAQAINTVHFSEAVIQLNAVLDAGSKVDIHNLYETAFQSGEKILILYLVKRMAVRGVPVIMRLAQHRDCFPEFLAWAISTDDHGVTPPHAVGKKLHHQQVDAILKGNWESKLLLLDLCKRFEQLLCGRVHAGYRSSERYINYQQLRCVRKFGSRLFTAIGRAGVGKGSFMWFVDQTEQLMDMMDEETCAEDDMEKIITWWVHSALKEAGASYCRAISNESDFCELIENVFLLPDSDCIEMLEDKRNTVLKFHRLQADLPSTMSNFGASGSHRLNLNSTESVVAILTPTEKNSKDHSTGTIFQCLQFVHT